MPEFSVMLLWGSILVNVKYREGCSVRVLLLSCVWLCDPIDGSPPGSPVPWILQARTMEWVAISFSNVWKWKVKVKSVSRVWPSGTPWTAALQAPPSMGFSRQEYWSGVPLPSPTKFTLKSTRKPPEVTSRGNSSFLLRQAPALRGF